MKSVNYINDSSFISKESYEKRQMFRNSCEIAGKHKSQEIKKYVGILTNAVFLMNVRGGEKFTSQITTSWKNQQK